MKFRVISILVCLAICCLSVASAAAPAVAKPVLEQSEVQIQAQGANVFSVSQSIVIGNAGSINDGKVEHTFSKINGSSITGMTLMVNGNKVEAQVTDGKALSKVVFKLPAGVTDKLQYRVEYATKLMEGQFAIPLLVPAYASTGKTGIVHINFAAPPGTFIQENSFPVMAKAPEGNKAESTLVNLPSHVSFPYAQTPSSVLNVYNIISFIVFSVLMLIIIFWIGLERDKKKIQLQV